MTPYIMISDKDSVFNIWKKIDCYNFDRILYLKFICDILFMAKSSKHAKQLNFKCFNGEDDEPKAIYGSWDESVYLTTMNHDYINWRKRI